MFEVSSFEWCGVHESAVISDSANLSDDVSVGPFSVISSEVEIKSRSIIGSNVFIGKGAIIGEGALIHSGVKIGPNVRIGDGLICHSNAVIGSDGFSFVSPGGGGVEEARKEQSLIGVGKITHYVRIASLGSVVIGNDVEIGAGSVIDRGTIENTTVGNGTKIDNLVQIAHNVEIGSNSVIAAQTGVAGSTKIGSDVMIGGQVGIVGHIKIANGTKIAAQSGVAKDIKLENTIIQGSPSMPIGDYQRSYVLFKNLPKLRQQIIDLNTKLKDNA